MPGGPTGGLLVTAEIQAPEEYASTRGQATIGGGLILVPKTEPFPRAVWAPKTPLPFLLTVAVLVGIVWCTYGYVFVQLVRIRKGAKS